MARLLDLINRIISKIVDSASHRLSGEEAALIIHTNLFKKMSDDELEKLIASVRVEKFSAGELILKEGAIGDELFILAEGSVCVFIKDAHGTKIQLKELLPGHYFGEQALYGEKIKTRNANIEAITAVKLLKIQGKYITNLLKKDESLASRIEERKLKQSVNIMLHASIFRSGIEEFLSHVENPHVLEFKKTECIFKAGDPSDMVYMILQGKVKLLIPDNKSDLLSILILNKGHLFGELGVMNNAPRSATAIAEEDLRLLAIDGVEFKNDQSIYKAFTTQLSKFQKMYQLPMRGTVEQFAQQVPEIGTTIVNVYNLDDGRIIHSTKVLNKDIFTMTEAEDPKAEHYVYVEGENRLEIFVVNQKLIGITAIGNCESLADICHMLLDNVKVTTADIELFKSSGKLCDTEKLS